MNEVQIKAADAMALLDNEVFKSAIKAVSDSIEVQAVNTNPNDEKACAKIIQSKQLLAKITKEIRRYVENGQVQNIIEADKKKTITERVFMR